jgi:lysozyme
MKLTPRIAAFIASEEGLVREAYRDSNGIWTWALGVTNASGHEVYPRYLDEPQSIERCIEVSLWLMQNAYLPAVEQAFRGHELSENQIAAALSFHWNTGAILSASWVRDWRAGELGRARRHFMEWRKPAVIIPRRQRECDLLFDGKWPALIVPVYPVAKPSYSPRWSKAERIDLGPIIAGILP